MEHGSWPSGEIGAERRGGEELPIQVLDHYFLSRASEKRSHVLDYEYD